MIRKKSRTVPALLAVLLTVAMLNGCGSSTNEGVPPASGAVTGATTVGINVCTTCHTVQTADWLTSKHANAAGGDLDSAGSPTLGQVTGGCAACHEPNGDSANIIAAGYIGNIARPVIGCEACHGGGSLHYGSGPISLLSGTFVSTSVGTVQVSGQFVMCTNCHELLDTAGTGTNPAPAHLATAPTGTPYFITDTHFATPGVWTAGTSSNEDTVFITGYAMDFNDERVCTTCHNPHKPASQNREWALSGHADKNFKNLNSAISPAKPTGYFSGAWAHYNWTISTNRACQRCHTTTGFTAYADALRTGNSSLAAAIRLGSASAPLLASNASFKPEMLKCNGCHTDTQGNLRNPGPITANYDYVSSGITYAQVSHTYPDLAGSNVCMTCHVGREAGDTIKALKDSTLVSVGTTSINFGSQSFINSHYLSAGGQVFTSTGYEFIGRLYTNINEYLHDKIGTPSAPNTGSNGPCIGCHMSRPGKNGNHLFLPVSRSTTTIGLVTGIASEVCIKCHTTSLTDILNMVNEEKLQYLGALEALKDQLELRGYYFFPYSPYFFVTSTFSDPKTDCTLNVPVKNWQTGADHSGAGGELATSVTATLPSCSLITGNGTGTPGTGKNNMGAAFNFNLLEHDPGAYVHNRMYVKRLIYDAIDWLDDGLMNYSVGATLDALPPATLYKAEAMTYLLPGGTPSGIEAERP
jgi:hypothetical protein